MKKILTVMLALALAFALVACDAMIEKQAPVDIDDDADFVDDGDETHTFTVPGDNGLELLRDSEHAYLEDIVNAAVEQVFEDRVLVELEREDDETLELKFRTPTAEVDFTYDLSLETLELEERDAEDDAEDYARYAACDVTMLEVIGLAQAELPEGVTARFKAAELEEEDGRMVYEVKFAEVGEEYGFYYEAVRADVIETADVADIPAGEDVLVLAIDAVKTEVPEDAILVDLEREDNDLFELKFETATEDHKYYYSAADGAVTLKEVEADDFNAQKIEYYLTAEITMVEAIEIAKNNLPEGITARFEQAELDIENGKPVYEVEFESADVDYEFVIDAISGEILKQDD